MAKKPYINQADKALANTPTDNPLSNFPRWRDKNKFPVGMPLPKNMAQARTYKIIQRGRMWCVTNEAGTETIKCHPTRQEAVDQLRAIEARKA